MASIYALQIDRLRFMKELRSLNMEGNPIAQRLGKDDATFRTYIAAFLPTLKYYNYKFITDDERKAGLGVFEYGQRSEIGMIIKISLIFFATFAL